MSRALRVPSERTLDRLLSTPSQDHTAPLAAADDAGLPARVAPLVAGGERTTAIPAYSDRLAAQRRPIQLRLLRIMDGAPRNEPDANLPRMAGTVRRYGVIDAICVVPAGDGENYDVVAGQRRVHAAREAGEESVEAMVYDTRDPLDMVCISVITNFQRRRLSVEQERDEIRRLYALLVERYGSRKVAMREAEDRIGIGQRQIQRYLTDAQPRTTERPLPLHPWTRAVQRMTQGVATLSVDQRLAETTRVMALSAALGDYLNALASASDSGAPSSR